MYMYICIYIYICCHFSRPPEARYHPCSRLWHAQRQSGADTACGRVGFHPNRFNTSRVRSWHGRAVAESFTLLHGMQSFAILFGKQRIGLHFFFWPLRRWRLGLEVCTILAGRLRRKKWRICHSPCRTAFDVFDPYSGIGSLYSDNLPSRSGRPWNSWMSCFFAMGSRSCSIQRCQNW